MARYLLILLLICGFAGPAMAGAPLTLDACLQLARSKNPLLLEAASGPRLAGIDATEAYSSYRPRVELSAGYTEQQAAQQVVIGGTSAPTQKRNYPHASIGLNQLLYDFGRASGRVEAAGANRRAAGYNYSALEQDVLLRTVAAYYRVLTAQALLQAAHEEVAQTEAHRKTALTLYQQGVVTRNDLLQAEVRLAASRQLVLARAGEENNAWLELNYLTARPNEARGELIAEAKTIDSKQIPEATDKRPDLLAQTERISSAQAKLRQTKGDFWPELYAHLGADYVDNSYVKEQTIYAATLGLKFTLYDGSARAARLSRARETLQKERQHLAELHERAQLAEQTARNDAKVAAEQIDVAQTAISMAEENLRINQDRYREQVGTATEVLDAETLLTQARTDLARAQFDYRVALARISHAVGTL